MLNVWEVTLCGGLELRQGGGPPAKFRTRKAASLFALLAAHPGRSFTRDELCEQFWPEQHFEVARHNLRQTLSTLRSLLEPKDVESGSVLAGDRTVLRLEPKAFLCDVTQLERALQSPSQLEAIEAAVNGIRGEFLPGFEEEWVAVFRARVNEHLGAALKLLARASGSKDPSRALIHARRLVDSNPLDEEAQGIAIRLLAELGRPEDALAQYRSFRKLLKQEFGDEPDPALTELALSLKGSSGSLDIASLPAEAGRRSHPPLPVVLTRTFGREGDLEALEELVAADNTRLVTLLGPGGTGKTRLAVELSHRLAKTNRAWFVPLADVREPEWVLDRIVEAVGLKPERGKPAIDQLAEHFADDPSLLVLDNVEQLLPKASSAVLLLLNRIQKIQIVATSRKPVGAPGEVQWRVDPLPFPAENESASSTPSVELFADRAKQARSDFRLSDRNAKDVAGVCRHLEGIPLALELAAARLKTSSTSQLLQSLSSRFAVLETDRGRTERHSSLWKAIDWSYTLLSPEAQKLFCKLSVFRGGWDANAARAVATALSVDDLLETLRSHSLIAVQEAAGELRYTMLETLREFAEEKLPASELPGLLAKHAAYFRALSSQLHEDQRSQGQDRANEKFALEQPNMLAVVERGLAGQIPVIDAIEVANRNYRFWEMRGLWRQARSVYERLLQADRNPEPSEERALALISLSNLMRLQGEAQAAVALTDECLAIREQMGNQTGISSALGHLAQLHHVLGNYDLAVSLYERCLRIQEEIGADWSHAMNLLNLGWLFVTMNRLDDAAAELQKSLGKMEALGDNWGVAAATGNLAEVAFRRGDFAESRRLHGRSLSLFEELRDLPAIAEELEGMAAVALAEGLAKQAAKLLGAAGALRKEIASVPSPTQQQRLIERRAECEKQLSSEVFSKAFAEGEKLDWQGALRLAAQPG